MENVDEKMTNLLTELGEINDRLASLSEIQKNIENSLNACRTKVDDAFEFQKDVETSITNLTSALNKLEATVKKIENLQKKANDLEAKLSSLNLDGLQETVNKAAEGFEAYQAKIDKEEKLKKQSEKGSKTIKKSAGKGKK